MKNRFFKIILLSILSQYILSKDYLLLSLNLLSTSCMKIKDKVPTCTQKSQSNDYKNKLLVHGLWSSKDKVISNLTLAQKEYISKLSKVSIPIALETELNRIWVTIYSNPNKYLWIHEYSKHGHRLYNDFQSYLQQVASLYKSINGSSLLSLLIKPNQKEYTFNEVYNSLSKGLGNDSFDIKCHYDDSGKQYLDEVRVYFTLTGSLLASPNRHYCSRQRMIYID